MKKSLTLSAVLAALVCLAAPQARAQTEFELGPHVGFEINDVESFLIGANLRVSSVDIPFKLDGTFDYYFTEDGDFGRQDPTAFRLAANALYELGYDNQVFTPYLGAGVSFLHTSGDRIVNDQVVNDDGNTDVGLNLIGGLKFEVADYGFGAVRPFAQAAFVPLGGDVQPFQITGGLLFSLGGR